MQVEHGAAETLLFINTREKIPNSLIPSSAVEHMLINMIAMFVSIHRFIKSSIPFHLLKTQTRFWVKSLYVLVIRSLINRDITPNRTSNRNINALSFQNK